MRRRHSSQRSASDELGKDVATGTAMGIRSKFQQSTTATDLAPTAGDGQGQSFLLPLLNQLAILLVGGLVLLWVIQNTIGTNKIIELFQPSTTTTDFGFGRKPAVLQIHSQEKLSLISTKQSPLFHFIRDRSMTRREIYMSKSEMSNRATSLMDSDENPEYRKKKESMYSDDPPCEPQYEWQLLDLPVCNLLHEMDITETSLTLESFSGNNNKDEERDNVIEKFKYLSSGGYRDVFMVRDHDPDLSSLALKTLKLSRNYTENHYDRHRRDAMVAERLTSCPTSVDIYAYCANSAIYQFAKGGNLKEAIYNSNKVDSEGTKSRTWSSLEMLKIAYQVAEAVANVHNVDMEGRASIAHTDISTDQFISIDADNVFKINDFNRARFIRWNFINQTTCPFFVKSNKGKNRSPEEYNYEAETEKVDVYSMGNVIFFLATGETPFLRLSKKAAKKAVMKGVRPDFGKLTNSSDPNIQALMEAANMCWVHDPTERATSRQVQHFLASKLLLSP